MKALLVTSKLTFVPNNYDTFVAGLANCPHIGGLLVLDNGSWSLAGKALGLMALGARRTGFNLLRNHLGNSHARRTAAYARAGKPVWTLPSVNCDEAIAIIREHGFDLVINARTRFIYKKKILEAPRLGCINVHHGLLPLQRGTMCDLWALAEGSAAGFSVHRMSEKIDAGAILAVVRVSDGDETSYARYLARAAERELVAVQELLARLATEQSLVGQPNVAPPGLKHRRNPTRKEIAKIRKGGLEV